MSMCKCADCEKIYDSDEQLNANDKGDCVCDDCGEKYWDVKPSEIAKRRRLVHEKVKKTTMFDRMSENSFESMFED